MLSYSVTLFFLKNEIITSIKLIFFLKYLKVIEVYAKS